MTTQQRNALERMVETFQMGASMPEEMDLDSPEMKVLFESNLGNQFVDARGGQLITHL